MAEQSSDSKASLAAEPRSAVAGRPQAPWPICQLCGNGLIEIRAKLQCPRCHTIWETCCEGGRC
jgi:hypothetical protein